MSFQNVRRNSIEGLAICFTSASARRRDEACARAEHVSIHTTADPYASCVSAFFFATAVRAPLEPGACSGRQTLGRRGPVFAIQKGTRVLGSLWESLMFGRVLKKTPTLQARAVRLGVQTIVLLSTYDN